MSAGVLFFDGFLTLLLLAVGGLMVVLYIRVRALTQAENTLPVLSDQFVQSVDRARTALRDMGAMAQNKGTELDDKIFIAERALQDLTYVLDRAEKILARLDGHTGTAPVAVPASVTAAPAPVAAPLPREQAEPRGFSASEAEHASTPQRRRKTDTPAADAVVMPGRQAVIARRLAAQSQQPEAPVAPAYKPSTRHGSAAAYAAMGARTMTTEEAEQATVRAASALSDVERDLRRALEENL
ncbi:MAG: hypothetical protein GC134_05160 [Proteobacteria bacterium]|nr:hypothetical protein [Pseudomonadota bacterium]